MISEQHSVKIMQYKIFFRKQLKLTLNFSSYILGQVVIQDYKMYQQNPWNNVSSSFLSKKNIFYNKNVSDTVSYTHLTLPTKA